MCLYKYIKKIFPINSYWYWGNERYGLKTIIKITVNEVEKGTYTTPHIRGRIVYQRGAIVQNDSNYIVAIKSLYPLTKEEQQQWLPYSLEVS